MGSGESSLSAKKEYQSYKKNFHFAISDLNEKIKSVYIISVPLKGSKWQLVSKLLLTISFIGAPLVDLIPEFEHLGLIFRTDCENYFYAQFPSDNGKLIKATKDESIEAIINGCEFDEGRKWFIKEKFVVNKETEVTIKNIYESIRNLRFDYYNIVTKNCQLYVDKIIRNIPNIYRVGYDGRNNWGYFNSGKGGDLSF